MPEMRIKKRIKKRLSVRFGHGALDKIGFTCDVSKEGLFLETQAVYKPGVSLNLELTTRDGSVIQMEGQVRWSKKAPLRLNHTMKSGMGICGLISF